MRAKQENNFLNLIDSNQWKLRQLDIKTLTPRNSDDSAAMDKYSFVREIGAGSFGKVFLVKSKAKGISYVVKQVDLKKLDRRESQSAAKEVEVLAKLRHNNIVAYKESFEKNNVLNIVLEYCENGDLHERIKERRLSNKLFGENEILDYFVQICLAIEYIHGQRILHRDLKTKNIFLTKGNTVKLGDFGIAKVLENSFELAQTCIGSPFYVSPEICESKPYNKKSDIWALGCVLYELATLKYAFVAKNVKNLLTKILTGTYNPLPLTMNIHIRGLISVMLKPNPKDRPSIREILEKKFLIRRRAVFIYKAHKNDRRSRSGDAGRNLPLMMYCNNNNNNGARGLGKLSVSSWQLNQLKDQKKLNNVCDSGTTKNNLNGEKQDCPCSRKPSPKANLSTPKSVKLPKVDSEYYDLIAGNSRIENLEKKDDEVGKQKPGDPPDFRTNTPDSLLKMITTNFPGKEVEETTLFSVEDFNCQKKEVLMESRKKWIKNTSQRKTLLAALSDTELLEDSLSGLQTKAPNGKQDSLTSIDDMLSLQPSEIGKDVLIPIQLHQCENDKENEYQNSFQLLQHEVKHVREKYELNNKTFQIEDLLRLTNNSKRILSLGATHKHTESERKVGESVYYNLEYRKVTLERKVGFSQFLKCYGKMISLINNEYELNLKNFLENKIEIDGSKTYIIPKFGLSGDSDDLIKNIWKSIISILGEKQEYLPDIWELAMSENIYYH